MIPLLFGIIIILLVINVVQYRSHTKRSQNLDYLHHKINDIIEKQTSEKLLLFTADRELQTLLIDLNRLLERNSKVIANYTKMESSIKKMLTNMSHDLKTPLTVVLGLTETISNDLTLHNEDRKRLLKKVHEKATVILTLMNKFFDLAKLESGDVSFSLTKIQLNTVCKNNILFFYENIVSNGLEVAVDIPECPVYAKVNEELLNRILNNLLSNAIRYGADGKIIGITLRYDNHYVYIDIWDRGKGIDDQQQELIFDRLYTLEDSRNRLYSGSGLGLTITKKLVETLEGSIMLQSKPYEKTIFTVRFKKVSCF